MKRFKYLLRTLCLTLILACALPVDAATAWAKTDTADAVELSLITCSPHEEVYSLYGHSALRYRNKRTGQDFVFNYGVFNPTAPHFMLRFVFGLTDYELGIVPTKPFCDYYRKWGSSVTEQVLNLTEEEEHRLANALAVNLQPENKVYRYNIFYDNCSTRPRDIIERNVMGRIVYLQGDDDGPSYRQLIHALTEGHPWARFGNDMLLGAKADRPTTQRQREFLPLLLMADFDSAYIAGDQLRRPLVKVKRQLVAPGVQTVEQEFPLSPTACFALLLAVSLLLLTLEWRRRRTLKYWDALLMLLTGLAGCIILLMFFSQHPTTSTNLLVFLLNPLPLFFIPAVLRRRPLRRFWTGTVVGVGLFFAGSLWQDYAEGMEILALCLLIRAYSNLRNDK